MKLRSLLLMSVLSLVAVQLSATTGPGYRSIPYAEINPVLQAVEHKAQSKYVFLRATLALKSKDLKLQEVKAWLERDGQKVQEFIPEADGKVMLPALDQEQAEASYLVINQPKDAVSLNITTGVMPPQTLQVAYHDLFIVLEDTNQFMRELVGGFSLFMPDMDALKFVFTEPAVIEIQTQQQTLRYETDDELAIELDIDEDLMEQNPKLIFSHLAKAVIPVD